MSGFREVAWSPTGQLAFTVSGKPWVWFAQIDALDQSTHYPIATGVARPNGAGARYQLDLTAAGDLAAVTAGGVVSVIDNGGEILWTVAGDEVLAQPRWSPDGQWLALLEGGVTTRIFHRAGTEVASST